jgi:hypothetical protein
MPACQSRPRGPSTPNMQRLTAITHARFSLFRFRSPLLTESRLLSLPVGTEMFHFPTFPPLALCVQARVTGLASSRVSPFGNPRITVWLSTPRGLSQIPTSFFGSWCQGIHRVPLETWLQILRCSRPLCSSQHTGGPLPGVAPTPHTQKVCGAVRPQGRVLAGVPVHEGELAPEPSGPNNVPGAATDLVAFHSPQRELYSRPGWCQRQLIDVPPLSTCRTAFVHGQALDRHCSRQLGQRSLERR